MPTIDQFFTTIQGLALRAKIGDRRDEAGNLLGEVLPSESAERKEVMLDLGGANGKVRVIIERWLG